MVHVYIPYGVQWDLSIMNLMLAFYKKKKKKCPKERVKINCQPFQVWFKNRRAKCRQIQKQHQQNSHHTNSGTNANNGTSSGTTTGASSLTSSSTHRNSGVASVAAAAALSESAATNLSAVSSIGKLRAIPPAKLKAKNPATPVLSNNK